MDIANFIYNICLRNASKHGFFNEADIFIDKTLQMKLSISNPQIYCRVIDSYLKILIKDGCIRKYNNKMQILRPYSNYNPVIHSINHNSTNNVLKLITPKFQFIISDKLIHFMNKNNFSIINK